MKQKENSMTGTITTENLSGLPLNQEWQRLLIDMIASGVDDGDAVETMLSTALGNLSSLYGSDGVLRALLPIVMALAQPIHNKPETSH